MAYPPLTGRLHTRYSPVRRSPPQYCYLVLPLDLHVLSLSLAFILSQDQTLRCQFVCFFISLLRITYLLFQVNWRYYFYFLPDTDLIYIVFCTTCWLCNCFKERFFLFATKVVWLVLFSECKDKNFILNSNYFWSYFLNSFFVKVIIRVCCCLALLTSQTT